MKIDSSCEVIRDLLPLYVDDACSEASKQLVRQHIEACENCKRLHDELKRDEIQPLMAEAQSVVGNMKNRRKRLVRGMIISFASAALLCMALNLCISGALSWSLIVASGCLLVGVITILPLTSSPKYMFNSLLGGITAGVTAVLAVCAFVTANKNILWTIPYVLFGISLVLLPIGVKSAPLDKAKHKTLWVLGADTLLLLAVLCAIRVQTGRGEAFLAARAIAVPLASYGWLMAAIGCLPLKKPAKTAVRWLFTAVFVLLYDGIANLLLGNGFMLSLFAGGVSIENALVYLSVIALCAGVWLSGKKIASKIRGKKK